MADAARRPDQLGDDHVGPCPAEHEPQRFRDHRRGARQQHAPHDPARGGAERVRRLDEIAPRPADRHGDHQHDLEERADEDDQQLLRLADACPQDQQRDERRRRKVARERDEGLEERLDGLVRTHRDAERHADQRGEDEAAEHAPDRDADVLGEAELREERPALVQHRDRVGEERLRHEAPERHRAPDEHEQHEECEPERGLARGRDGLEGRHRKRGVRVRARPHPSPLPARGEGAGSRRIERPRAT